MDIKVLASGSSGNCYRISDGKTALLLDAGIPLKEIQRGLAFKTSSLAGAFITHEHGDHSRAGNGLASAGIDVYASYGTIKACKWAGHRFKPVSALADFEVGTFTVTPFDVRHDAAEPLGFLFTSAATGEKLLYATDSEYIKYRFDGLTHIMAEANYDWVGIQSSIVEGRIPVELVPRIIKSHMSLDTLLDMLKANDLSKVRQIYLLHLSDNNSDEKRFKENVQKLTGAEVYVC